MYVNDQMVLSKGSNYGKKINNVRNDFNINWKNSKLLKELMRFWWKKMNKKLMKSFLLN